MKKLFILFILIFCNISFSQKYKYYINLNDYNNHHHFRKENGILIFEGENQDEADFFKDYEIYEYIQAFEYAYSTEAKNIFYVEVNDSKFVQNLVNRFPNIYKQNYSDITNITYETLEYYPNDYGTSSQNPNLGFPHFNKEFDYINAPKAWDIEKGNINVKIGISDTPIYYTDPDFLGKINPIDGYTQALIQNSHGTSVASTAAANGNNSHGSVGVCMDCSIVEASASIGYPTPMSNLYKMYLKGAKVINMSWTNSWYINWPTSGTWIPEEQVVINDLTYNFGVTLVAAAGNRPSFATPISNFYNCNPPFGILYVYPASYDNVISVSSIRHKNSINLPLNNSQPTYVGTSPYFPVHVDLEDSVSCVNATDPYNPISVKRNGWYQDPCNPDGFQFSFTLNELVDIVAPGYDVYAHGQALFTPNNPRTSGTSISAPMVTGTIGLMRSVNDCLLPYEIESILKLTSKDIESGLLNSEFAGMIGAGKLDVYKTVDFTNEMKKTNGVSIIKDHVFNRFNFRLDRINNVLKIQNCSFLNKNVSQFKAKQYIDLLNTDINPANGSFDIKTDSNINICTNQPIFKQSGINNNKTEIKKNKNILLYPNPNDGIFHLELSEKSDYNIGVYNSIGILVYETTQNNIDHIDLKIQNISSGVYFIKINDKDSKTNTIKFIKN